jgi:hypothetical protein
VFGNRKILRRNYKLIEFRRGGFFESTFYLFKPINDKIHRSDFFYSENKGHD